MLASAQDVRPLDSQTVELRSGGGRTAVTTENRQEYLQSLAQYRLATRCRAEVDAFLRGLNDLVPDNLLGIFDENELEVGSLLRLYLGWGQNSGGLKRLVIIDLPLVVFVALRPPN